ncbi:hypothetical protein GGR56DRAFT_141326 [Xylariaceae sp. FL0804]|nr:hypothetical protein GGR56DRAFT_141326 [Xylariaceae sp. FL0804]
MAAVQFSSVSVLFPSVLFCFVLFCSVISLAHPSTHPPHPSTFDSPTREGGWIPNLAAVSGCGTDGQIPSSSLPPFRRSSLTFLGCFALLCLAGLGLLLGWAWVAAWSSMYHPRRFHVAWLLGLVGTYLREVGT